ncbi:hypothetical protein [Candidatus Marithrix sp. Canyon 246]|uniref:hypothetical protein n=1 Tax=Candidatus Marithrix sp. Canyon 246 TaxID=1827136 RepID=UPI00084A0222|nr:hypothetical protein [Candidatus Marithrix sp. Canyon 246]
MEIDKAIYSISTQLLIETLNINRVNNNLIKLEDILIARKLSILFTFKTNHYISFKQEMIKLNKEQLLILEEIIDYYFNIKMTANSISNLTIKPKDQPEIIDVKTNPSYIKIIYDKFNQLFKSRG